MHADLAKLIDSVSRRVRRIELDTTIEQSAMARCVVMSDVLHDRATTVTRYSAVPSEALEGALLDVATWVNAQSHRTGYRIETYTVRRVDELHRRAKDVMLALINMLDERTDLHGDDPHDIAARDLVGMARAFHVTWSEG